MRLRNSRIEDISREIVKLLQEEKFIEMAEREAAVQEVYAVIREDLMAEEKLDEEVRKILEQYLDTMNQDHIQYHEMFKMVKAKLAKERNIIL